MNQVTQPKVEKTSRGAPGGEGGAYVRHAIRQAFPLVSEDEAAALAPLARSRRYDVDQVMIGPEQPPLGLTIITGGAVRIEQDGQTVREFEPYAYLGEGSLIRDEAPAVTLTCSRPTTVLVFPKAPFLRFLDENPAFGLRFTTFLLSESLARLSATNILFAKNKALADKLKVATDELSAEVQEREKSERKALFLANRDPLTGLSNRSNFSQRIDEMIEEAGRAKRRFAVIMIDLDGFKEMNDTHGHHFGDAILKVTAERIEHCARKSDTVARLGGDEFILIQNFGEDPSEDERNTALASLADRLIAAVNEVITHDGVDAQISASVGVALFPEDGQASETLMRNADLAMYQAKKDGRGRYKFFTPVIEREVIKIAQLKHALKFALDQSQFVVNYQPKINIEDNQIVGMEALLRWDSNEAAPFGPADFIPVAESSRYIVPIGRWILNEACRQTKVWRDQGLNMLKVAVNLSPVQFRHDDVIDAVDAALNESGLPPEGLEIEITESVLLHEEDGVVAVLNGLRERGISIAVDDFGTGYSSMSYLKKLQATAVKIDRAFVRDCHKDLNDQMICQAIIGLAHSLNMSVVAEGVEFIDHLHLLRKFRCDQAQGYLIARPLAADAFEDYLQRVLVREIRAVAPVAG
ncbi:MAG: EAL domain-containing protein [Pseudomonadota bacterium]